MDLVLPSPEAQHPTPPQGNRPGRLPHLLNGSSREAGRGSLASQTFGISWRSLRAPPVADVTSTGLTPAMGSDALALPMAAARISAAPAHTFAQRPPACLTPWPPREPTPPGGHQGSREGGLMAQTRRSISRKTSALKMIPSFMVCFAANPRLLAASGTLKPRSPAFAAICFTSTPR